MMRSVFQGGGSNAAARFVLRNFNSQFGMVKFQDESESAGK